MKQVRLLVEAKGKNIKKFYKNRGENKRLQEERRKGKIYTKPVKEIETATIDISIETAVKKKRKKIKNDISRQSINSSEI